MNTRRNLLAGMSLAALGGAIWYGVPEVVGGSKPRKVSRPPFANVALYTQDGVEVHFYDDLVRGKVVAINMMYVHCDGICPTMTANLRKVQELLGSRLGRDIFMYSITLQPHLDTPQVLKAYAEKHGVKPGWLFLTGEPEDVRRLRYSLGFFDPVPEVDDDLSTHTGMLRIGNDRAQRWTMAPALCEAPRIIATINHVDTSMVVTRYRQLEATG
ncbi:SCO family protein [Metapseudomonas boanensis]|uniref:SCO family protein n=1 Tax=Metapseudomonas boanensis TaxID=2822138 RepID=A0ABS5XHW8_9GAMM|nr:SCO family protein [Pseudomonas boanensis]MBT8767279.1 SCO family protein [Pseudomonas boanensis]